MDEARTAYRRALAVKPRFHKSTRRSARRRRAPAIVKGGRTGSSVCLDYDSQVRDRVGKQTRTLRLRISAQGLVEVRTKGAKGKQCLDYVRVFNTIGKVSDQQLTGEYYEPEPTVIITDHTQTQTRTKY